MKTDITIDALDLDCIKVKLMDPESGDGWSRERADTIELEYRRFLLLMKKFPHERTAPIVDVDTFWHCHILDTMKYAADCEQVFGYFLHHFPYLGMRGDDDAVALRAAGERMQALYEQTFGTRQLASAAFCGAASNVAFCGAPSTPAFCGQPGAVAEGGVAADKTAAFCGASVAAAFCGAPQAPAFCGVNLAPAFCGSAQPARLDAFYTQRPQLAAAAT